LFLFNKIFQVQNKDSLRHHSLDMNKKK
jgi:hypothetical protein